jgi:hypothetical protein
MYIKGESILRKLETENAEEILLDGPALTPTATGQAALSTRH